MPFIDIPVGQFEVQKWLEDRWPRCLSSPRPHWWSYPLIWASVSLGIKTSWETGQYGVTNLRLWERFSWSWFTHWQVCRQVLPTDFGVMDELKSYPESVPGQSAWMVSLGIVGLSSRCQFAAPHSPTQHRSTHSQVLWAGLFGERDKGKGGACCALRGVWDNAQVYGCKATQ